MGRRTASVDIAAAPHVVYSRLKAIAEREAR